MRLLLVCGIVLLVSGCPEGGPPGLPTDGQVEVDASSVATIDATSLRFQEIPAEEGQSFVDLRSQEEWAAGHVPRAVNVPLAEVWDGQGLVAGGQALLDAAPVKDRLLVLYGSGGDDEQVLAVARAASGLGYRDVRVLEGGMASWRENHFYEDIELQGLLAHHYDPIPSDERIVDAMSSATYAQGHIPGALNLDANLIWDSDAERIKDGGRPLVDLVGCDLAALIFYCVNEGCHASTVSCWVAEQLDCFAGTRILHFPAGTEGWRSAGLPLACGTLPDGQPCTQ